MVFWTHLLTLYFFFNYTSLAFAFQTITNGNQKPRYKYTHLHFSGAFILFSCWVCDIHNTLLPEHLIPEEWDPNTKAFSLLASRWAQSLNRSKELQCWLNHSLKEEARTTQWARIVPRIEPRIFLALCSSFRRWDQASSLISCQRNKGWH